jgi:hypothetical protein
MEPHDSLPVDLKEWPFSKVRDTEWEVEWWDLQELKPATQLEASQLQRLMQQIHGPTGANLVDSKMQGKG